jgi:hypothetical protein
MSSPKRGVLDFAIIGVAIILVAFSLKVTFDMLCDLPEVRLTNIIVIMFVLYFDVQILNSPLKKPVCCSDRGLSSQRELGDGIFQMGV